MPSTLSPQEFVAKWRNVTANERKVAQSHFNDLCILIGHENPVAVDPDGTWFTFEAGAGKQAGGHGWADVWKRGFFGWEYKSKDANLEKAYGQLLQYREALENPPLLIVSDIERIEIHANFTNTAKCVITLTLDDLLTPSGIDQLRNVFFNPTAFKSKQTTAQVTQQAAEEFARLAELLRKWGVPPQPAAHFLIRILFCLFAEDIGLLPNNLFSRLVKKTWMRPADLTQQLKELFGKMATGGWFGADEIAHFNGGLFDDDTAFDLDSDALNVLSKASELDWSNIEPSIFGTLFQRSLDPSKRSQIGAHFTSKEDIALIVEPVLMAPLRRRWAEVEKEAREIAAQRDALKGSQTAKRNQLTNKIRVLLMNFDAEIARLRVLDAGCGSGNFLYVALREMLDLEKQVILLASKLGVGQFFPTVSPTQLFGIEIDAYAHELAQTTVWIGYIQWLRENGFGTPSEPILKPLHNIMEMDAILAYDSKGKPIEPQWHEADVIIGNPPFLGGKLLRSGLGDKYVDDLFALYDGRVPREADLVTYWFEKARAMIEAGKVKRVGLLATQGIRGGANRKVLERIKKSGDIFMAWSDRDWILDGAAVRVSMIGFDGKSETTRTLNGATVQTINADLTALSDLTIAKPLEENKIICFMGDIKVGAFDIDEQTAKKMLSARGNPNGRQNSDVIRPWMNGLDITKRSRNMWIIDFGIDMPEEDAAQYEMPFEHVRKHVRPLRIKNRMEKRAKHWWIHGDAAPRIRNTLASLKRYIATPGLSKHRLFVWLSKEVLPDHQLLVFARDDDYFLGVLHSKPHELWALRMGTALTDRPRYTPTTTFGTFPFPWAPGKEPKNDPRVKAIAKAARELVLERDRWLNPPDASESELKKRTLTNLYNQRPTWLDLAHRKLDDAVLDAYGWQHDLSDDEILARLLALNLERAAKQK